MVAKRLGISASLILATVLGLIGSVATAAPNYSEWSAATNLGTPVNTSGPELGAGLSKDGLSLYFTAFQRTGGFGLEDIWVSQRASEAAPWGAPQNLGSTINTAANERVPQFSRDGHWMFFGSTRPGGFGASDLYASWRRNVHDDFGWQAPTNLGANINTAFFEPAATYFENEDGGAPLLYFTSNKPGGMGDFDLYVSTQQADGSWGPATPIVELNSPAQDARPTIRHDGLEVFFHSARAGGQGGFDLYAATRASTMDAWSVPANLGPLVNSASDEFQPAISSDRQTLVFVSNRPGGNGAADLYQTTRTKQHGQP